MNVERFRNNDLVARSRSLQVGNDLGFLGEIVDQFGLDRQLHRFLDVRNGPLARIASHCAGSAIGDRAGSFSTWYRRRPSSMPRHWRETTGA